MTFKSLYLKDINTLVIYSNLVTLPKNLIKQNLTKFTCRLQNQIVFDQKKWFKDDTGTGAWSLDDPPGRTSGVELEDTDESETEDPPTEESVAGKNNGENGERVTGWPL